MTSSPGTDVLDSEGMFAVTAALGEQLTEGAKRAAELRELPVGPFAGVAVCGMGGSGVAGEVLQVLGGKRSPVPILMVNGYELPAFVGAESLVVAVSFSGNTEETLAAAEEAAARGSHLVVVTGGGKLLDLARAVAAPIHLLPSGIPEPRAGLGAMLGPLLVIAERVGLYPGASTEIAQAATQLERRRDELAAPSGGIAAQVARQIGQTIPLVHGGLGVGSVAARRWKTQINENTKSPAFHAVQPELCHNEICAFGLSGDVTRQVMTAVMLRSDFEHSQVKKRFALVAEILEEVVADVVEVHAEGEGEIAQLLDLITIGDFVSLHLAVTAGVDPGPVPVLVALKERLGSTSALG